MNKEINTTKNDALYDEMKEKGVEELEGKKERIDLKNNKYAFKHGFSSKNNITRFYNIWRGILLRCNNKNDPAYKWYGARGIKCLWNSFDEFIEDMFPDYCEHCYQFGEKNTSIDREDNNGHYCFENCRWTTMKEQNNNSRNCKLISFNGKKQNISQWAEEIGLNIGTLYNRLFVSNWSIKKSLTTKLHYEKRRTKN